MKETFKTFLIIKNKKKKKNKKFRGETYHPKPSQNRNLQEKKIEEMLTYVSN